MTSLWNRADSVAVNASGCDSNGNCAVWLSSQVEGEGDGGAAELALS